MKSRWKESWSQRWSERWYRLSQPTRWIIVGITSFLIIWFVSSFVLLVQARAGIQSGVDRLENAKDELTAESLLSGKGAAVLREAAESFESAHASASSPLLTAWDIVPVIGQQTRAIDALTAAAVDVADAAEKARASSAELVGTKPTTGADRLAMLEALRDVALEAQRDLSGIDLGPDFLLAAPIADARDRFAERLMKLRQAVADAGALSAGARQLLEGPRRYLVLGANNGEMRAGSGMLLSAGVATFANGEFELGDMESTVAFNPRPGEEVAVPEELEELWGWVGPTRDWRELATSPRFDATGQLAADMWEASTGETVDGVLVVDPIALQALVAAQGPVEAAGRMLDADAVLGYLLLGQYEGLEAEADQEGRRDELSTVARAAVDALDTRPWDTSKLVGRLSEAGRGRHVLAWARDHTEQRAWEAGGIAGTLGPDSMLVSILNFGGNKLDQFLTVDATLDAAERSDGATDVTVILRLRNEAPDDIPAYVAGVATEPGVYQGVVAANVPGSATEITLTGAGSAVAAGPDGPTQALAAGYFKLARGAELEVSLEFKLPPGVGGVEIEPSARIPAIRWHVPGRSFEDFGAEHVEW